MHLLDSVKAFSGRLVAERQRSLEVPMKIVALGVSVCVCVCVSQCGPGSTWAGIMTGIGHRKHPCLPKPSRAEAFNFAFLQVARGMLKQMVCLLKSPRPRGLEAAKPFRVAAEKRHRTNVSNSGEVDTCRH